MYGNKIIEKVEVDKFLILKEKYSENQIECTRHVFFRLSDKQRLIYTEKELCLIIIKEKPFLVGLQHNGNYAAFYHYDSKTLKVIMSLDDRKVNIVTFYFISEWQIPRI